MAKACMGVRAPSAAGCGAGRASPSNILAKARGASCVFRSDGGSFEERLAFCMQKDEAVGDALSLLRCVVPECRLDEHTHSTTSCGKRGRLQKRKGNTGDRLEQWPCGKTEHTHTYESCLQWWFPAETTPPTRLTRPEQTTDSRDLCGMWDTLNQLSVYFDSRFKSDFAVCGCHFTVLTAQPAPSSPLQLTLLGDGLPQRATVVSSVAVTTEPMGGLVKHGSPAANTRGGSMVQENPGEVLDEAKLVGDLQNSSKEMIIAWCDDFTRFGRKV